MTLDPYRLAAYGLLLVSIGRVHQHFSWLAAVHPAEIMVGIAGIYAFLKPSTVNLRILDQWPARVVAGLVVWACVTAPFGLSLGGSGAFILFSYSKVLLTAAIVAIAVRKLSDLRGLVWAYVISCGVLVVFGWTVFDISQAAGSQVVRLGNLYMYDANDVSLLFCIGIPFGLWLARSTSGAARFTSLTIVVGMVATIARSGSRGGFVGLIAVGLALLFLVREISWGKKLVAVVLAGGVLTVAAPPGYWSQMETMSEPTEDYNWESYYGRKQTWERGIGYALENPVTGVGIDNFTRAEGVVSERARHVLTGGGTGRLRWHAAHNSFIQVASELGLPGFVLYAMLVFGCLWSLRRWNRRLPVAWRDADQDRKFLYFATVYLPVALVGFIVTSFFLTFAYLDPVYLLAALTMGVVYLLKLSLVAQKRGQHRAIPTQSPRTSSNG